MRNEVVIPADTQPAEAIITFKAEDFGAVIQVDGSIGAGEAVELQQENSDETWSLIRLDGVDQVLTQDAMQKVVYGVNKVKIVKPLTGVPVGVRVIRPQ